MVHVGIGGSVLGGLAGHREDNGQKGEKQSKGNLGANSLEPAFSFENSLTSGTSDSNGILMVF